MPRYREDRRDRYRNDYDRRSPRPVIHEPDNSGATAIKIIAILGGVFVACVLVCGGLAYYVFYSVKQGAQRVGDDFAKVVEKQQEAFEREQKAMQLKFEEEQKKAQERFEQEEKERKEQFAKEQQHRKDKLAEKGKATRFANSFLTEAKAGRTADAYAMTSPAYRKRVTQQQFAELITEYTNTLRGMNAFRDLGIDFEQHLDPPFTYSTNKPAKGGWIKVELTVTKEGDDWKIDQLFVGPYDPFKK